MKRKILIALALLGSAIGSIQGQEATPAPSSSAEIQELREQVQALTEMVKALQQQVQEQQQAAGATTNPPLPQNPEPAALPGASASPAVANATPPQLFPTTDESVVASSSSSSPAATGAAVNAGGTAFPTTDESVATNATISSTGAG